MGFESRVIFAKCCVSFILLLSASWVQSQCPSKCKCDMKGLRATCNNQNLVIIPQGPFYRKLQIMDLSFNRIGILKPSMFADQQIYTLVNLTMSNNTISDMNEPFRGLSALEYLDLSNNDISTFDPAIFDDTQHLKTLILHHNPYLELAEYGYDLPELMNLILNNCNIKTIPSAFFKKLKTLEFVNLSENSIENFDSKVLLKDLENLKHIDLRSNRMHLLHEVVDQIPTSVEILKISFNAWSCGCEIKEAFALYEKGNYENSPLICASPEDLKNHSLTEELVSLITCTTTTEETTSASTTSVVTEDIMVEDEPQQGNLVEKLTNSLDSETMGKIVLQAEIKESPPQTSETMGTDKADDVVIAKAGWYGNWMIYSVLALVVATSIVVFFVKYQVTKHMRRPGNALERRSADFGMSRDGYHTVSLAESGSRLAV